MFQSIFSAVVQEAVGTSDPELLSLVIQHREFDRLTQRTGGIPETLESLEQVWV